MTDRRAGVGAESGGFGEDLVDLMFDLARMAAGLEGEDEFRGVDAVGVDIALGAAGAADASLDALDFG